MRPQTSGRGAIGAKRWVGAWQLHRTKRCYENGRTFLHPDRPGGTASCRACWRSPRAHWAGADEEVAIEEVIVTAAKREQGVYEVPVSLSVFDGDGLEKRGLVDIGKHVPNLVVTTFSAAIPLPPIRSSAAPVCRNASSPPIPAWAFTWTACTSVARWANTGTCSMSSASKCRAAPKARCTAGTPSVARSTSSPRRPDRTRAQGLPRASDSGDA